MQRKSNVIRSVFGTVWHFLKRHKIAVSVIVAAVLIILLIGLHLHITYSDPGIDHLYKYAQPLFESRFEQIYVHIESDRSIFDMDEDISLRCKVGFLHDELAFMDRLEIIVESDDFDTDLSCPAVFDFSSSTAYERDDFEMNCTHREVTKKQLPFAFDITLSKKDGVSDTLKGAVNIRIWGRNSEDVIRVPDEPIGVWRDLIIYYYAAEGRIYLSDISVEDAIKQSEIRR